MTNDSEVSSVAHPYVTAQPSSGSSAPTWSTITAICNRQVVQHNKGGKAYMSSHLLTNDNCVTGCIGSQCTQMLIDTGADHCCMSYDFYRQIKTDSMNLKERPSQVFVSFAGGNTADVFCDIETDLLIDSDTYSVVFHVVPGLQHQAVIGRDFLRKYGMNIRYLPEEELSPREITVKAEKDVTLPPYTEMLCSQKVDISLKEGLYLNYVGFRFMKQPEVWTARCCVKVDNHTIPVRFANVSDHPVVIKKGTAIGTARPLDSSECIRLSSVSSSGSSSSRKGVGTVDQTEKFLPKVDYSHSQLTMEERKRMDALLMDHCDAFVGPDGKVGCTDLVEHEIELVPGAKPVQQMPFRMSPMMRDNLEKEVQKQVDLDILEPIYTGSWASPCFLLTKSSGGFRLICDYRKLNEVTVPKYLAIPRIDDVLDAVGQIQPNFITALDLMMAFHQIPISEKSKELTAFLTPFGKFAYKRLSMGLKNSARSCQMVVDLVLQGLQFKNCICYIDDIVVFSQTFDQHLKDLGEVLSRVSAAGLKLKPSKCIMAAPEVPFLGHILNHEGIKPNPQKVEAIHKIKPPKNRTQIRRFLGMTGFYRKFIPDYATRARVLYTLTKKNVEWVWAEEHQQAFDDLKQALTSDTLLIYPNFSSEFVVTTDASNVGIGGILSQRDKDGNLRPVAYTAKLLNSAQRNYSTLDRELAAIVHACLHWRVYLEGREFLIQTDHAPLKYILNPRSKLTPRQIRWAADLRQFQFNVVHVKGTNNVVSDALSRPNGDETLMSEDDNVTKVFPKLTTIKIKDLRSVPVSTIERIPKHKRRMNLKGQGKDKVHFDLHPVIHILPSEEDAISVDAIETSNARPNNIKRNRYMARLTLQNANKFPEIGITREDMIEEQRQDVFCRGIVEFITEGVLPEDVKMAKLIVLRESQYAIVKDILYHIQTGTGPKSDTVAQVVVPLTLQPVVLHAHHDSPLGGHLGANKMLGVMRCRYYWPNLTKDVVDYALSCETCAQTKRMTRPIKPCLILRDPAPHAWSAVNLDALERLPITTKGNVHIAVVVDYYSRYTVCMALPDLTAATVARHFFDKVICRFGAPKRIVMDNGKAFASKHFEQLCAAFGITQSFTSVAHPMTSGVVERQNRTILGVLRNYISENQTDWDEHLDALMFSINTTPAYSTQHSPHMLIHGCDPMFPTELQVKADLDTEKTVSDHFAKILQTQEKASKFAAEHMKKVHAQMKERYDKTAYDPGLEEGDICWLYWPRIKDPKTKLKLARVFHGPYAIVRYHTETTVFLRHTGTGKFINRPVNIMRLKRGMSREEVNKRWQPIEENIEDPEELDEGDLPLDSFELIDREPQTAAEPCEPADKDSDKENANGNEDDTVESDQRSDSGDQAAIDPSTVVESGKPPDDSPIPSRTEVIDESPKAVKILHENPSDNSFHLIKKVTDVRKPRRQEVQYLVYFQDKDWKWLPISHLNQAAIDRYVTSELHERIRETPALRQR